MTFHFGQNYTRKQVADPATAKGRRTEGAITQSTISATIQPASWNRIRFLPELRRGSKYITIYTDVKLQGSVGSSNPDRIIYDGDDYEVVQEQKWDQVSFPLEHYEFVAVKL